MISCQDLTYSYSGSGTAVNGVSLELSKGEFVAVMGANGSGKTTVLKLLIGLLKPSSGRISLDRRDFTSFKEGEIFRRIGMVFQDPNDQLFASTVGEDAAFGPSNLGLSKDDIARTVDASLRDLGIYEMRTRAIHTLSFGQKRRAALAGVLAMQPDVILLDEPTGGLDPLGTSSIMSLLRRINREKNITMVMATHDVDLVPLFCDRIAVMQDGQITASGRPAEVLGNPLITRQASLRLPRLAHLFEILSREDGLVGATLPLTIGEARHELLRWSSTHRKRRPLLPGKVK